MNPIYEIDRNTTGISLDEAKRPNGEIPFRAPALTLDEFTKNGRRYPKKVIEAALAKITGGDGRTIWGSAGHVAKFEVPDVSHRIDRLWIDNKTNLLMIEGVILPTSKGLDLATVLKAGKLGLSVKGFGTVKDLGEGKSEVESDYRLAGCDFTLSPASTGAMVSKANLYESVDFEEISEDGEQVDEEQELCAKINEAVKAGLAKVDNKIRSLVEIELKGKQFAAVELVADEIKEIEAQVRFVLIEAERSKLVQMVEAKPELGILINYDNLTTNEKRNKAIVQEARAAGSTLSVEEILKPLKK